jgi:phosphatidylserine decarboxylase
MIKDGIYYALGAAAAGAVLGRFTRPVAGIPFYALAGFCLYFFRDPDREIPQGPYAVSPADGKVISIVPQNGNLTRISIFLNVFDVHVNRTPISGVVRDVYYKPGKFLVASHEAAATENEQNTLVVEGDGAKVIFRQVAGLIARRIVCWKKPGDRVQAGERIGLIKFGSRVDVYLGSEWDVLVRVGQRVSAGSSVLARRREA